MRNAFLAIALAIASLSISVSVIVCMRRPRQWHNPGHGRRPDPGVVVGADVVVTSKSTEKSARTTNGEGNFRFDLLSAALLVK